MIKTLEDLGYTRYTIVTFFNDNLSCDEVKFMNDDKTIVIDKLNRDVEIIRKSSNTNFCSLTFEEFNALDRSLEKELKK